MNTIERTLEKNNLLFDLYCHRHNHTSKVIGYPIECDKCMEEKLKKSIHRLFSSQNNKEGSGKTQFNGLK